jgi:WhiB family redox-sensing transcriptional regulator
VNNPYADLLSGLSGPEDDFREQAVCRTVDPELFFVDTERGAERRAAVKEAQSVCAKCPVTVQCLSFAVENSLGYGVWGGVDVSRRKPGALS